MDPNIDFVAHLPQGLRRKVDAVPSGLRQDLISVLDDLIRVRQPGVLLTSAPHRSSPSVPRSAYAARYFF